MNHRLVAFELVEKEIAQRSTALRLTFIVEQALNHRRRTALWREVRRLISGGF